MLRTMSPSVGAVTSTGLGGAVAVVVIWLIESLTTLKVPSEVAIAFGVIFGAFIGHSAGFLRGEQSAKDSTPPDPASNRV